MTSPITLQAPQSKYTLTGYPVVNNGCKGFLATAYTDITTNITHKFSSNRRCLGILVSDNIEGIIHERGWDVMGRSLRHDPIPSSCKVLLPYFNKPITCDEMKGWYIITSSFSKKTVESWFVTTFGETDHLLFEQLL